MCLQSLVAEADERGIPYSDILMSCVIPRAVFNLKKRKIQPERNAVDAKKY